MTAWVSVTEARLRWADAPMDDDLLRSWLDGAQTSCEAYAPSTVPDPLPESWLLANVLAARENYEAAQRDSSDVVGFSDSGYAIRVRPLSSTVKQLLRPRRAVPAIGTLGQS